MLKILSLRRSVLLLSFLSTLVFLQPAVHATTLDPTTLIGTDTAVNRQHILANLRSLERQLVGTQKHNKYRVLTQAKQHTYTEVYMSYHVENGPVDPRERYDPPEPGTVRYDVKSDGAASRMLFRWSNHLTWGGRPWEDFDADKHQGMQAMRLEPLSRYQFSANVAKVGRLVAHPDGWSVCRVELPHRGTYIYGYYDSARPYCILGDPQTMQWNTELEIWQVPVTFGRETDLIPRRQQKFAVLPARHVTRQHVLSNMVQVNQQARGFAIDNKVDHRDTLWPSDEMGYRVWRLVNQQGVFDFTVRVHEELAIEPTQCALQLEIPATVAAVEALRLTYTTPVKRNTRVLGRYRCTVDENALRQWLVTQQEQYPHDMAEVDIGDLAFLSVHLQYNLAPLPDSNVANIFEHSRKHRNLMSEAHSMQNAIESWYELTLPYQNSFWLRLLYPSYASQNRVLAAFRGKNLVKIPFKQLIHLVQDGFPADQREALIPRNWAMLPEIGQELVRMMGEEPLSERLGELPDKVMDHRNFQLVRYWPILSSLYLSEMFHEAGDHQTYQQLHTSTAGSPLTGTYYPLPAGQDVQYQRVRSYAYDKLSAGAGSMEWRLVAVNEAGQDIASPQAPDTTVAGDLYFTIQPEQRYRLYLEQDAAEAWAASHLYLAAGKLQDFTADNQADDGYYLTFSGGGLSNIPTIMQYQSRTRDGRVYDTSLTFSIWSRQQLDLMPEILKSGLTVARELADIPQQDSIYIDLEMAGAGADPSGNQEEVDLTLQLSDSADELDSQYPEVTVRLSDCLERLDQGPQPCRHDQVFTSWPLVSMKQQQLHQPLKKITPKPWANNLKQLNKKFPVDKTRPQQLTVRIPQQDQQGNTQGYQQRWYTLYDPERQYHRYSAQNITQGVDPLMIRSVIWQMQEATGQNVPIQQTTLELTDDHAVPEALRQAIADYNNRTGATSSPVYRFPVEQRLDDTRELDNGLDDIQPDQPPAFFNPHHISQVKPDIAVLADQGQQLPSFIYPTHELPAGRYTFQQTSTLSAGVVETCDRNSGPCIAGLQPAWETSAPYQLTETFNLTIHEPEGGTYTPELTLTPDQRLATIAPGVQWQIATEMVDAGQQEYPLPYAYPVWDLHSLQSRTGTENAVSGYLPPRQPEQQHLVEALRAMGYQPVTQQLQFCDARNNCEILRVDSEDSLEKKLQAYHYLQLESAQGDTLTIDIPADCPQDAEPGCVTRRLLAAGAIAYRGTEQTQAAEKYQITAMKLLKLRAAYTGSTDAAQITEVTLSHSNPDDQPANLYVAPHYQTLQTHLEMTAEDWIELPPRSGFSNNNNQLYIDLEQFAADRFCIRISPEQYAARHLSVAQVSALLGTERQQFEQTEIPGNYCLDTGATALWYDSLQQGHTSQLQISVNSHTGQESQIIVTVHSLAYLEAYLRAATSGSAVIIENYDPDNALRQFDISLSTDFVQRILIDKFGFAEEDITLHISDARVQLNLNNTEGEENTSPWVSYPVTENGITLAMTQTEEQATLALQNVLLTGNYWSGELQTDLTVTVAGHDTSLVIPQAAATNFHPYLDPQVRLRWRDYHSQRAKNELGVAIRASLGQTLDLDWVSDNLQDQLSAYYNPVLARLDTDLQVAHNIRELVDQVLADVNTPVGQATTWVRASRFPQLYLHIEQQAWNQLDQNPSILMESTKVRWTRTEEVDDKWYVPSMFERQDLFIGLAETDAAVLQEWYEDTDTERPVAYAPQQPVTLYQADGFTAQLAEHEPESYYSADVLQSSWDFFAEDVAVDFEKYKDNVKSHMNDSTSGSVWETSSYLHQFKRRRTNMLPPSDDEDEENPEDQGGNGGTDTGTGVMPGAAPPLTLDVTISGTLRLNEDGLRENMQHRYAYYTSPDTLQNIPLRTEFPLAKYVTELVCMDGLFRDASRNERYTQAIRPVNFTVPVPRDQAQIRCRAKIDITPNHLTYPATNGLPGRGKRFVYARVTFELDLGDFDPNEEAQVRVHLDIAEALEGNELRAFPVFTVNGEPEDGYYISSGERYPAYAQGRDKNGTPRFFSRQTPGVKHESFPVFSFQYLWKENDKIIDLSRYEDYQGFLTGHPSIADHFYETEFVAIRGWVSGFRPMLVSLNKYNTITSAGEEAIIPSINHVMPGHFVRPIMYHARRQLRTDYMARHELPEDNNIGSDYIGWTRGIRVPDIIDMNNLRASDTQKSQDFYEFGPPDVIEVFYFLSEYVMGDNWQRFIEQGSYYKGEGAEQNYLDRQAGQYAGDVTDLLERQWKLDFKFLKTMEDILFFSDYAEYSRSMVGDILAEIRDRNTPEGYNYSLKDTLLAASIVSFMRSNAIMANGLAQGNRDTASRMQYDTIQYAHDFRNLISSWTNRPLAAVPDEMLNQLAPEPYTEYNVDPSVFDIQGYDVGRLSIYELCQDPSSSVLCIKNIEDVQAGTLNSPLLRRMLERVRLDAPAESHHFLFNTCGHNFRENLNTEAIQAINQRFSYLGNNPPREEYRGMLHTCYIKPWDQDLITLTNVNLAQEGDFSQPLDVAWEIVREMENNFSGLEMLPISDLITLRSDIYQAEIADRIWIQNRDLLPVNIYHYNDANPGEDDKRLIGKFAWDNPDYKHTCTPLQDDPPWLCRRPWVPANPNPEPELLPTGPVGQ